MWQRKLLTSRQPGDKRETGGGQGPNIPFKDAPQWLVFLPLGPNLKVPPHPSTVTSWALSLPHVGLWGHLSKP